MATTKVPFFHRGSETSQIQSHANCDVGRDAGNLKMQMYKLGIVVRRRLNWCQPGIKESYFSSPCVVPSQAVSTKKRTIIITSQ